MSVYCFQRLFSSYCFVDGLALFSPLHSADMMSAKEVLSGNGELEPFISLTVLVFGKEKHAMLRYRRIPGKLAIFCIWTPPPLQSSIKKNVTAMLLILTNTHGFACKP